MNTSSFRTLGLSAGTITLCLTLASVAAAQEGGGATTGTIRDISRLGGSTALYRSPLTTAASVKRMAGQPAAAANLRTVLRQGGSAGLSDRVIADLMAADTSVRGGLCSDATPADGTIVECDVQPGQTMRWMAYRPQGGSTLGLLRNIRWAGAKPFRAFLFRVTENNAVYTFIIPKVCGNLTLMSVADMPRASVVEASAPPSPGPVAALASLEPPSSSLVPAAPPSPPPPASVAATAPPPPPPAPSLPFQGSPPGTPVSSGAEPAGQPFRALPFFVDALVGKDRRVRPIEGTDLSFAQCSPLLGLKLGMAKRFQSDWELAAAVGIALSLVTTDDKLNEHQLFADVEANKYLEGGTFIGTGLSLWDLTHSDTVTPAWMVHVGLPLAPHAKVPVYFLAEGRLFFDQFDDVRNNYQFWGGVRLRF